MTESHEPCDCRATGAPLRRRLAHPRWTRSRSSGPGRTSPRCARRDPGHSRSPPSPTASWPWSPRSRTTCSTTCRRTSSPAACPAWWPVPWLVLCGLLTGADHPLPARQRRPLTRLRVQDRRRRRPSDRELPGIILAALTTLSLGAVLGPEAPLIAIGGGLAALTVHLVKKDAPPMALTIMASAGSFAAISTLLGSPAARRLPDHGGRRASAARR